MSRAIHPETPDRDTPPSQVRRSAGFDEVERVVDRAYRKLVEGRCVDELLASVCQTLEKVLEVAFVAIVHRRVDGALELEAASRESWLWAALTQSPERWDGAIAGKGPCVRALKTGQPAFASIDEPGFLLWREAARRDGLRSIGVFPLRSRSAARALLLGARDDTDTPREEVRTLIESACRGCARLIDAAARLRRERLLASAVADAGDAAAITDSTGRMVWYNHSFAQQAGLPDQDPNADASADPEMNPLLPDTEALKSVRSGQVWRGPARASAFNEGSPMMQTITPFGTAGSAHYLVMRHDREAASDEASFGHPDAGRSARAPKLALESRLKKRLTRGATASIAVLSTKKALFAGADRLAERWAAVSAAIRLRLAHVFGDACVAGFGCGEFLVDLGDNASAAERLVDTLRSALLAPLPVIGFERAPELSIGIARCPDDGHTLEALMRAALRRRDQ